MNEENSNGIYPPLSEDVQNENIYPALNENVVQEQNEVNDSGEISVGIPEIPVAENNDPVVPETPAAPEIPIVEDAPVSVEAPAASAAPLDSPVVEETPVVMPTLDPNFDLNQAPLNLDSSAPAEMPTNEPAAPAATEEPKKEDTHKKTKPTKIDYSNMDPKKIIGAVEKGEKTKSGKKSPIKAIIVFIIILAIFAGAGAYVYFTFFAMPPEKVYSTVFKEFNQKLEKHVSATSSDSFLESGYIEVEADGSTAKIDYSFGIDKSTKKYLLSLGLSNDGNEGISATAFVLSDKAYIKSDSLYSKPLYIEGIKYDDISKEYQTEDIMYVTKSIFSAFTSALSKATYSSKSGSVSVNNQVIKTNDNVMVINSSNIDAITSAFKTKLLENAKLITTVAKLTSQSEDKVKENINKYTFDEFKDIDIRVDVYTKLVTYDVAKIVITSNDTVVTVIPEKDTYKISVTADNKTANITIKNTVEKNISLDSVDTSSAVNINNVINEVGQNLINSLKKTSIGNIFNVDLINDQIPQTNANTNNNTSNTTNTQTTTPDECRYAKCNSCTGTTCTCTYTDTSFKTQTVICPNPNN